MNRPFLFSQQTLSPFAGPFDSPDTEGFALTQEEVALLARVILYNDDIHTFDEVALQLMKAIGCSWDQAETIAYEVDSRGHAIAFEGDFTDCLRVSGVLEEIALHTEVTF